MQNFFYGWTPWVNNIRLLHLPSSLSALVFHSLFCSRPLLFTFLHWGGLTLPPLSSSVGTSICEMFSQFLAVSWFAMLVNTPKNPCAPTILPCANLWACRIIIQSMLVFVLCCSDALAFGEYSLKAFMMEYTCLYSGKRKKHCEEEVWKPL